MLGYGWTKWYLVTFFIVSLWKFLHLWNLFTYQFYRSIFGNSKFVISEAATRGVLEPVWGTWGVLNLFAATAQNNYAKTCRLYLQPIEVLKKDYPQIFEEFVIDNHMVWILDRSINQADSGEIVKWQRRSDWKRNDWKCAQWLDKNNAQKYQGNYFNLAFYVNVFSYD